MCYSPGFSKPTHGYGTPSGPEFSPDQLLGAKFDTPDQTGEVIDFEPLDDAFRSCPCGRGDRDSCSLHSGWAGEGFEKPYEGA